MENHEGNQSGMKQSDGRLAKLARIILSLSVLSFLALVGALHYLRPESTVNLGADLPATKSADRFIERVQAEAPLNKNVSETVTMHSPPIEKIEPQSELAKQEVPELSDLEVMSNPHPDRKIKDFSSMFGFARIEKSLVTETTEKGRYLKIDIYKTDFKYPLIRVAERWQANAPGGSDGELLARSAMVADHIIVKWSMSADPINIQKFLQNQQASIRDSDEESGTMLIAFDGSDPKSMGRMLNTLKQSGLAEMVSPDYLATSNPDLN